jgi:peptidoglycan/xylan/chitin deacetylase (PgdA/CDA1 family)
MGTRGTWVAALAFALLTAVAGCAQPGTRPPLEPEWDAPVAAAPATTSPAPAKAPSSPKAPATKAPATKVPATSVGRFGGPANSIIRTRGSGVALTFDDGPDPVQTPKILDLLAEYHVKATFCLIGVNVRAHPELVRRIVAEGHTICNHTWKHNETLGKQSPSVIRADLQRTNDAIRAAAPTAKIKYARAPGGNFTPAYVTVAADMGMTPVYWQVDPRDWAHPAGESSAAHRARVVASVQKLVRKGSIVLSHDCGQPDTIAAYRTLIPWLKSRYQLVALP